MLKKNYTVRHPADEASALAIVQGTFPGAHFQDGRYFVGEQQVARLEQEPPGSQNLRLVMETAQDLHG